MKNQESRAEVILGVDTQLDVHVGVVIDTAGRVLGTLSVGTHNDGYKQLLCWAQTFGLLRRAGVEGTGSYGAALTHELQTSDVKVIEINRPDRSRRRGRGKSDATDAECAARAVLAGDATSIPKIYNGAAEALRTLSLVRRSAVKAKTQTINQIRALLVSAPQAIRNVLSTRPLPQSAWRRVLPNHRVSPQRHWSVFTQHCVCWQSDGQPSMKSYVNLMQNWRA